MFSIMNLAIYILIDEPMATLIHEHVSNDILYIDATGTPETPIGQRSAFPHLPMPVLIEGRAYKNQICCGERRPKVI